MTTSKLCQESDFSEPWYASACNTIKETPRLHRKQWEFAVISKVLDERGFLHEGAYGLGFAVGTEPLPSFFASKGCNILATDLDITQGIEQGWASTNQLCYGLEVLNNRAICAPELFRDRVRYEPVNMNCIPENLRKGSYDFTWSSCSLEHLGSIAAGREFLVSQLDCLRPGGLAVHTTEFNLSSETNTLDHQGTVLFRRSDILEIGSAVEKAGGSLEIPDFSIGAMVHDWYVDTPPYKSSPHLRLLLNNYVCTSILLIIKKQAA